VNDLAKELEALIRKYESASTFKAAEIAGFGLVSWMLAKRKEILSALNLINSEQADEADEFKDIYG